MGSILDGSLRATPEEPVKPQPPKEPPKTKGGSLMNEYSNGIKLMAGGVLVLLIGLAIGITMGLGVAGLAALGLMAVVGIGIGFLVGYLQDPWHFAALQRRFMGKNVGIVVVITKARVPKNFIVDYNKDYAEIQTSVGTSAVYWLSSNKVSPTLWAYVPTLFFYQGLSDPIPYESAVKDLKDDATFNNALMMKERAIAQANAILQFKNELLGIIKQVRLIHIITSIIIIIGIIVLYTTINGVGGLTGQNTQMLKECLNQTGIHVALN